MPAQVHGVAGNELRRTRSKRADHQRQFVVVDDSCITASRTSVKDQEELMIDPSESNAER
jgi:hypothetical protein